MRCRDRPAQTSTSTMDRPEEIKLRTQKAAHGVYDRMQLLDVCTIVDAKSQLPGLLLNPSMLLQAVLDELERRTPEFEEKYKLESIRRQRQLEQAVRERAADRRVATAKAKASKSVRPVIKPSGSQLRKRRRDETEQAVHRTEASLKKLRESDAPAKPIGAKPGRKSRELGPWNDKMRAHTKHTQTVAMLEQRKKELQTDLDTIGMSRGELMAKVDRRLPPNRHWHAIVPSSPRMVCVSKGYRADGKTYADIVHERGQEKAAAEPERVRLSVREECVPGGLLSTLAPYLAPDGKADLCPLAYYSERSADALPDNFMPQIRCMPMMAVEELVGRTQPETAVQERKRMIAATEATAEDYLTWGRPARQRLDRMQEFAERQERTHAELQLRHRGIRQVDLEIAAEKLEQQPLDKSKKSFRIQQSLKKSPQQLIVTVKSQAAPVVAALSDTHAVLIWVPDDDPRSGMKHCAGGWNLERDVLDFLFPQVNGKPRSSKTEGYRHRAAICKKLKEGMQSRPVAVVIAASIPVSKTQYRTVIALQKECNISVIVCDPGAADVTAAGGLAAYTESNGDRKRKSAGEKAAVKKDRRNNAPKTQRRKRL